MQDEIQEPAQSFLKLASLFHASNDAHTRP